MDAFDVTILGCSSATPAFGRYPTSQHIHIAGRCFLVDCGEGAQMQLRRFSIKFQRIDHIFISHLHGDHFLGLIGFLSSLHLLGRTEPLHIYCEDMLEDIISVTNKHSRSVLQYPIIYHALDFKESKVIFEDEKLIVSTIIMKHSIPCCGFLFAEKPRPRKLIKEEIAKHNVPVDQMENLKRGEDFIGVDGKRIVNSELTLPPLPPRRYAYCSDTIYDEELVPVISKADLLYHESTFMEDMRDRAKQTLHSTAKDAANIAKLAGVQKLIIGHFSARYKDLHPLLAEAKEIFTETYLAEEGTKVMI
ncbi:MAG TPA: ribonuclease Z [Bacteroidia bacterium]|nr:ribonuclease Z [Bacteroidia bacterium]